MRLLDSDSIKAIVNWLTGVKNFVPTKIIYQKNEDCYLECPAERHETKVMTTGQRGGSRGISIKIVKGVSIHAGGSKSHQIRQKVKCTYQGQLNITNKRVIFTGHQKSFIIAYPTIIAIKYYTNGFEFQTEKINYNIYVKGTNYERDIKGARAIPRAILKKNLHGYVNV